MNGFDIGARVMAHRARHQNIKGQIKQRLNASIARTGGRLPGLMAAPPLIGPAVRNGSSIAGAVHFKSAANGSPVLPRRFSYFGANWAPASPTAFPRREYFYGRTFWADAAFTVPGTGAGARVRFYCSAPAFELIIRGSNASFRVLADGDYVQQGAFTTPGDGSQYNYPFTFADSRQRLIEIEAANDLDFGGVQCSAVHAPRPAPQPDSLRLLVHGDSMVSTISDSTNQHSGLHSSRGALIGRLTGMLDCVSAGVGGTGWTATVPIGFAPGNKAKFNERIADIIAMKPDVIFEIGGLNDAAATNNDTSQAVLQGLIESWLSQILAALPDVLVYMTSPVTPRDDPAIFGRVNEAKKAAAAKFPRRVIFIDSMAAKWVTGTGRQNAANGGGNADLITGPDTAHSTMFGHEAWSRMLVETVGAL